VEAEEVASGPGVEKAAVEAGSSWTDSRSLKASGERCTGIGRGPAGGRLMGGPRPSRRDWPRVSLPGVGDGSTGAGLVTANSGDGFAISAQRPEPAGSPARPSWSPGGGFVSGAPVSSRATVSGAGLLTGPLTTSRRRVAGAEAGVAAVSGAGVVGEGAPTAGEGAFSRSVSTLSTAASTGSSGAVLAAASTVSVVVEGETGSAGVEPIQRCSQLGRRSGLTFPPISSVEAEYEAGA
jgi:hypothetical protein